MTHWWRAYDEAVDDPKLILLSDKLHRAWFSLLCVASANGGSLPGLDVVAVKLRTTKDKTRHLIAELSARGLLDEQDGKFIPHNWNGRQFKSDVTDPTAAERMRNYRNRQRNANVTVTVPREQITETDSERKKTDSRSVAKATRPRRDEVFEEFWRSYPRREGSNPKAPAWKSFIVLVDAGIDPQAIIAGVRACAAKDRDKIGTPYIPQAVKWLRDRRWEDYQPAPEPNGTGPPKPPSPGLPSHDELLRKYARPNEHKAGEGNGVRQEGDGVLPNSPAGGAPDDQSGKSGMGGVAEVFR